MNKKIIPILLLFIVVAGGTWWLMKKNHFQVGGGGYDPALDSIFYNINFGMTKQAFYDTCWRLNKTGAFVNGGSNLSVEHPLPTELGLPVTMNFYPAFSEKEILYQMPVVYNYQSWAPWNKELYSDTLIVRVAEMLEKDYGITFTKEKTKDGRPAYYNYTGPRKILITTQDEQYVKVLMENERYK
ncbi:MAG TPA: hypothetical protein VFG10_06940 [Saprospiraceae bacterium]|nr:hypothetical protein [Saprospiraceae bacterium]